MADYIYLLENRLSAAQQEAIKVVREAARSQGLTVFLVGGAVRDLTSGSPVRDLDVVVQGNALQLKKQIELAGGVIIGEIAVGQALFARFVGGVRMEIGSTLAATYPKPGKPVLNPTTILEDLRRRDFTANAMALSLNEGSYGLLMDPLNGVADIENRQLRLVSNYGFIEDPVRMIRAARFSARLGWTMDERTQARYETGKEENYIAALGDFPRGYETEEIFHEEDPLRILRKLEEEGWMEYLFPALTVAKANAAELEKLRDVQTQLQLQGIHPEAAAANFPLVTAKLSAKEITDLKHSFVRPGFVTELESLESEAKEFASQLLGKGAVLPSQAWKLLVAAKPEAVLWVAYSSKSAALQAKLKSFYTDWPQARNKIPYTLMQEMRIVPDLPVYDELVEKLFFELMDGKLTTVEEMKAYLESYSPPAPPPPVHLRRPRTAKKDAKNAKGRKKAAAASDDDDDDLGPDRPNASGEDDDDGEDAEPQDKETSDDESEEEAPAAAVEASPVRIPMEKTASPEPAPVDVADVQVTQSAKGRGASSGKAPSPVKTAPEKLAVKKPAPAAKSVAVPAKKTVASAKKAAAKTPVKGPVKQAAKPAVPAKKVTPAKKAAAPGKAAVSKAPAKKIAVKAAPAKKSAKAAKRHR